MSTGCVRSVNKYTHGKQPRVCVKSVYLTLFTPFFFVCDMFFFGVCIPRLWDMCWMCRKREVNRKKVDSDRFISRSCSNLCPVRNVGGMYVRLRWLIVELRVCGKL